VSDLAATELDPDTAAPETPRRPRRTPRRPRRVPRLSDLTPRTVTWLRRVTVTVWALAVLAWTLSDGLAIDHTRLLIMIGLGLIAGTIGRRRALLVIRDWLPFAVILLVYDLSRGTADLVGLPTQWHIQIEADKALFLGVEPTVWLQSHLKEPFAPWWETVVSLVYISYFLAPYAVAGVLWLRNRVEWRKFVVRFVVMTFIGLVGFVLVPAAPPWAASQCTAAEVASGPSDPGCLYAKPGSAPGGGLLGQSAHYQHGAAPWIERISNRGWLRLGLPVARSLIDEGQAGVNQVAAIPSLHAGTTGLIAMFLWPRVRRRWRPLVAFYPLAMAFVLVYSAEHFVVDILLGWLLAAAVMVGFNRRERRRADARDLAGDRPEAVENPATDPDTLDGPILSRP